MKRILLILLISLLCSSLFASSVSDKEVSNAFVAITDLGYIAASNFISLKRVDFDSIAIKISSKNSLPEAILLSNADLSTYMPYFLNEDSSDGYFASLIPSINPIVKDRLLINDWKEGEAVVTGAAVVVFPDGMTFQSLITNATSGQFPNVGISFSFNVSGSLFSESLLIKGVIIVSSDEYGVPIINPIRLSVNDKDYNLSFFEKAPLLLTMKNDV